MDSTNSREDRRKRLQPAAGAVRDLRGGVRLLVDGVRVGLDRMEQARQQLAKVDPPVGGPRWARPTGRAGRLLYWSLRGTADLLGGGLDLALASLQASLVEPPGRRGEPAAPSASREAVVAALNAFAGDHLLRTDNPLAIATSLRMQGEAWRPRVLVLVHDIGLSDLHWQQGAHDHGLALAGAVGATPVYARYNSGRHVAAVARELSAELEAVLARWRVPLEGVALVAHGSGGLVVRSALLQASRRGLAWPGHVRHLVFLGTPHHGAPEAGHLPPLGALGLPRPVAGALGRLAQRRSEGWSDFVAGRLLDPDPRTGDTAQHAFVGLPAQLLSHAIAGAVGDGLTDGLVPVDSALGRHPLPTHDLQLPAEHRFIAQGVDHLGLLASPAVFQAMRRWLSA